MSQGERLTVSERMIVAPGTGVFRPGGFAGATEGTHVEVGAEVGVLEGPGTRLAVRSPFSGVIVGMLALPGERLREGQPVAWLRVA